ncbi:hypothetical protein HMPREF0762_01180 [Slackia exigua ATCC 700122]|uniref:Uncharacterized protein n=1 Tax=Slackia exigua (strain ATCC 700122 / DSM 15923 / CIP 105133 / JCM 11022 / KCTC 5966 / S-7) TaxID=649764 RepID=D0WHE6_SLAES|nr:hypothetical protein HMPREF0762_01180 [Slackia exigua ATCC 700122]
MDTPPYDGCGHACGRLMLLNRRGSASATHHPAPRISRRTLGDFLSPSSYEMRMTCVSVRMAGRL